MKTFYFFLFVILICIVQVTALDNVRIFNVKPDLLLVAVVMAGLYFEWKSALFLSITAGFLKDACGTNITSLYTFLFPLWCYLVIRISRKISIEENNLFFSISAGIVALINIPLEKIIYMGSGNSIPFGLFLRISVIEVLYTALSASFLFIVLKPLLFMKAPSKEEPREEGLL